MNGDSCQREVPVSRRRLTATDVAAGRVAVFDLDGTVMRVDTYVHFLLAVMRRMEADAVPHGFRSTFRDWCAEHTNYPREVAEVALAHSNKDETEAAYLRSDLFVKRRRLMEEWAAWCASPTKKGAVIPLKGRRT